MAGWKKFFSVPLILAVVLPAQNNDGKHAVVKGRCVAKETGEPLPGCRVVFDGSPGSDELMNLHGKPDWKDPEPFVTGLDGRFEIRFLPPPPYQHHLDVSIEGRVPRTARWGPFKPGQVDDLGDVPLEKGYTVRGRMIDQDGKPVPRQLVGFYDLPLPLRNDAANDVRWGTTKADGTFVVSVPMPAGMWPIRLSGRGVSLILPDKVVVEPGSEPTALTVRVKRMPSISGVVFDDRGQPVRGVYIQARPGAGNWRTSASSRQDGSFTIYKRDGSPDEVRIEIDDPGPCEPVEIEGTHEWGTHGLRIVLRRALSFELTVVEKDTGKPVQEFSVKCHPQSETESRVTLTRLGEERHPDGVVVVDKVWRGPNLLRVIPRDPALRVGDLIKFDAQEDTLGPMRIELVRMQRVALRVVDAQGEPVADARVWIVDDESKGRLKLRQGLFDDPRGRRHLRGSATVPQAHSAGKTDADGKVELYYGPARGKLALVVRRVGEWLVREEITPAKIDGAEVEVR